MLSRPILFTVALLSVNQRLLAESMAIWSGLAVSFGRLYSIKPFTFTFDVVTFEVWRGTSLCGLVGALTVTVVDKMFEVIVAGEPQEEKPPTSGGIVQ